MHGSFGDRWDKGKRLLGIADSSFPGRSSLFLRRYSPVLLELIRGGGRSIELCTGLLTVIFLKERERKVPHEKRAQNAAYLSVIP